MKNNISIIKYIFCITGLVIFALTFSIYQEKKVFLEKLNVAQGTFVDNLESDSPILSFKTKDGRQIKFTPDDSNNLLSYREGESVEVLYDPNNPNKAKINEFISLYLGILVLGISGVIFFLTGFSFFLSDHAKQKKIHFLQQNGKNITTKFIDVQLNLNITVNGSHPYFICSEWLNPKNNEKYVFESEDIWFYPADFITTDDIAVTINPENPKEYYMDISFLPKRGN
jgi:hypothetical protein